MRSTSTISVATRAKPRRPEIRRASAENASCLGGGGRITIGSFSCDRRGNPSAVAAEETRARGDAS